MNKKIIFSTMVLAFIFSGCLNLGDAKPTINDKVDKKVNKIDKDTKKVEKVIKNEVKSKKDEVAKPEESKLQDAVIDNIENEVDITDDGTTIDKPQLIESVD